MFLVILLSISLTTISFFTFIKNERIVIIPPFEKEFWIDKNTVSTTYLEQFGYFLGNLLLSKSPQSASSQRSIILRHTDYAFIPSLDQRLKEEENKLINQNSSYVFYPIDIQVNDRALQVKLIGDRTYSIAGKVVSSAREAYVLSFNYNGSRLFLNGLKFEEI